MAAAPMTVAETGEPLMSDSETAQLVAFVGGQIRSG
jgi:hypothetical protein